MKTWKKALSCVLALVMVVCLLPMSALAVGVTDCTGGNGCNHEAAIDSTHYDTLAEAVNAAQDGDTVTLLRDVTAGSSESESNFWINKSLTLDLNSHTLTGAYQLALGVNAVDADVTVKNGTLVGSESYCVYVNNGKLTLDGVTINYDVERPVQLAETGTGKTVTIRNSTIKSTGTAQYAVMSFDNNNTIVIENSTVSADYFAVYHNGSYYGFTLTVEDSTLISQNSQAVYISGSTTTTTNAGRNQKATFTNCTITGTTGIEGKFTDITLNNCTVTATVDEPSFEQYNNGSTTDGFAVVSTDNTMLPASPAPSAVITINGGSYNGLVGLSQLIDETKYPDFAEATYQVSGGAFSTSVAEYVIPELTYEANNNGTYTYHATLSQAQEAAGATGTVTQIKTSGGDTVTGDTYTITLKNGTDEQTIVLAAGETITLDTPKRSGYYFLGWSDGTNTYPGGAKYTVTGNATLTARWASIPGTVIAGQIIDGLASQVQSPFVDVTTMDYYYDAVNWAVDNDITTGTGRYTFSPDEACTRAQAVTFLWRAAGSPSPKSASTPFVDVDSTAYYYKAVLWAVENGITNGTSATTFSPSETCTRAQIVTFLYRAFGKSVSTTTSFTDVAADAYYAPAVSWAAANSITGGTGNSKFSPEATCTRAQIVTFLYRCCG